MREGTTMSTWASRIKMAPADIRHRAIQNQPPTGASKPVQGGKRIFPTMHTFDKGEPGETRLHRSLGCALGFPGGDPSR